MLSTFSDAVTPYMRILKQRKDQVRYNSPIPFEIERGPELGASQLPVVRVAIETESAAGCEFASTSLSSSPGPSRAPPTRPRSSSCGNSSAVVGREVAWRTFLWRRSIASSRADSARSWPLQSQDRADPLLEETAPHSATGRNGSISRASHAAYERLSATGSAADQSLLEYQIIFENAIVGICSMRNRILLRCNRRMEQIFGFGPGELDQKPVRILYPNKEAYERIDKVYANFATQPVRP